MIEIGEISYLIRLFVGALGTFFAILLWSKTRDTAWVLIVLGTIITYTEIVFSTLEKFQIINDKTFFLSGELGFVIFKTLLLNLPTVLFIVSFIIVILRKRMP
jgi:hypothetical protein